MTDPEKVQCEARDGVTRLRCAFVGDPGEPHIHYVEGHA